MRVGYVSRGCFVTIKWELESRDEEPSHSNHGINYWVDRAVSLFKKASEGPIQSGQGSPKPAIVPESKDTTQWVPKEAEGILVRYHHCPRRKLFQPTGAGQCPVGSIKKTTHVQFVVGAECVSDAWRDGTRTGMNNILQGSSPGMDVTSYCPQWGVADGAQGNSFPCPWGESCPFGNETFTIYAKELRQNGKKARTKFSVPVPLNAPHWFWRVQRSRTISGAGKINLVTITEQEDFNIGKYGYHVTLKALRSNKDTIFFAGPRTGLEPTQ